MANIKVGDLVRVVRKVESEAGWFNSWTKTMDAALNHKTSTFTVDSIGSSGVYFTGDRDHEFCGLGFPPSSLEVVEKENKNTHGFKVGDRVVVAKKVTHQSGWDNNWNSDMDEFIGHEFTIKEITNYGIRFEQNNKFKPQLGFGFPSDALKLVTNKFAVKQSKSKKSYQYLRFPENHFFKDLCLTISTEIAELPGGKHKVDWAVAFKHPKDKFDRYKFQHRHLL